MKPTIYRLSEQKYLEHASSGEVSLEWLADDVHRWIDVEAAKSEELRERLAPLDLHPLVFEGCMESGQGARLARFERAVYLDFPTLAPGIDADPRHVSIVCLRTNLGTIHKEPIPALTGFARDFSGDSRLNAATVSSLLYHILDYLTDQSILMLLDLRRQADRLWQTLDEHPESVDCGEISTLRRRLSRLDIVCEDQLYCVAGLQQVHSEGFSVEGHEEYFHDLVERLKYTMRSIERLESRIKDLQQDYQTNLQDKTNNRIRVLTLISAVFLPLTLIAGIYGMNFQHMPEVRWEYGYMAVVGVMLIIALGMLAFFRHRGWFD